MADTTELKKIKKIYGEKFKNLCRDMFPVILEQDGKLLSILESKFSHNCNSLYESITENGLETEFKNLIFEEFEPKKEKIEKIEERSPYEILDEAGYNLYECETEDDIQNFEKYYAPNEILCTIYMGGRLNTRDCFFAVRKDVDKIRREDFINPQKEDEYSTSVLGIQFTRDAMCTAQIISRYNHTVSNPNCTLGNDLDRLAPGLSQSFTNLLKERGLNFNNSQIKTGFEIPGYTLARDGKYYKYNMEVNGTYYCPNNIIIENGAPREAIPLDRGMVIDNFCIDFKSKEIKLLDDRIKDSFVGGLQDIEKMEVKKLENDAKVIKVYLSNKEKPVVIGVDKDNQIVKYENQYLQQVGYRFLYNNTALAELNLPELQQVGEGFLWNNTALAELNLPELQQVGEGFLWNNTALTELNLPELQQVGDRFLEDNTTLMELNLPKLQLAGHRFLFNGTLLTKIDLSELKRVGDCFLFRNIALTELNMPDLQQVGDDFLKWNTALNKIDLPKLQQAGGYFLYNNTSLTELSMPKLKQVGNFFMYNNTTLNKLNLPELEDVTGKFLRKNCSLVEVNLPKNPALEELLKSKNIQRPITPSTIAKLDRKKQITTSEIKKGNRLIKKSRKKNDVEI